MRLKKQGLDAAGGPVQRRIASCWLREDAEAVARFKCVPVVEDEIRRGYRE